MGNDGNGRDVVRPLRKEAPEREWLTPAEVAELFRVTTKTVARWAASGKLPSHRTVGGHRRFNRDEVMLVREIIDRQA